MNKKPLNNYEANLEKRGYTQIKEPVATFFRCHRCGGLVSDMNIHDKYHREVFPDAKKT